LPVEALTYARAHRTSSTGAFARDVRNARALLAELVRTVSIVERAGMSAGFFCYWIEGRRSLNMLDGR
jgi:hypothetical protein